jgi:hypothetical protein
MNDLSYAIGLDVGGTSLKSALVSSDGSVCMNSFLHTSINSQGSKEDVIKTFIYALNKHLKAADDHGIEVDGIGIGMPGPFDYKKGVCLIPPHLHKFQALYGLNIREELAERIGLGNIQFENDAWTFLRGEEWTGMAKGFRRIIGITIGTGMGSSFMVDGKIVSRGKGIPLQGAMLTDVPSAIWSLPSALALSGVRYFAHGVNPLYDRGPFYPRAEVKPVFWWEGRDGSRVLTWLAGGYGQANELLGLGKGIQRLEETLPAFISGYERSGYPFDAILVYGSNYENAVVDMSFTDTVREWNSKHESPKLILCSADEFFRYMEDKYGEQIPVVRGDEGCYWEDGIASSANETAMVRKAQDMIVSAEKLWTVLSLEHGREYPEKKIKDVWNNLFLYDEHTWGAFNSVSDPDNEFVRKQWAIKSDFAKKAYEKSVALLNDGRASFPEGERIIVFNQLSWRRSGIARLRLKRGFGLFDEKGKEVEYQRLSDEEVCFLARDLPELGYKTYESRSGAVAEQKPSVEFFENGMENSFYRIELDPVTGAISSIYDKEMNAELVDKSSEFRLNEYIYAKGGMRTTAIECNEALGKLNEMPKEMAQGLRQMIVLPEDIEVLPGPDFEFFEPMAMKIRQGRNGPVFGEIVIESVCENTPSMKQRIALYRDIKRIDIINEIDKREVREKEGIYIAFPFDLTNPEIRIEIPDGFIEPERDQLKGACRDWYCVQHQISLSDKEKKIILAPLDAPLVQLQEINTGKWLEKLPMKNGWIFSYIMNNYWHTNYRGSQKGGVFRYSITTGSEEKRFGWSVANEPIVGKGNMEGEKSFMHVSEESLLLLALKRSEDEKGFVTRFLETEGKDGTARISFPFDVRKAFLCNLVEENVKELETIGGSIDLPYNHWSVVTLKFQL